MLTDKDLEELRQERHDDYVSEEQRQAEEAELARYNAGPIATRWSNQGPPAGFGGEYAWISGLKYGCILIQASQDEANLIAAAPELLAALKACQLELHYCSLQLCSSGWSEGVTVTAALKAGIDAITKAEGGAA